MTQFPDTPSPMLNRASNHDQPHFDVLIVGGGLAGSSMAAALCQLPLSIAIVEATEQPLDQSPSFDDRALALSYGSLQILQSMSVLSPHHHCAKQTPIETIHVSDRGHSGFLRMHHDDVDVDCLGAVMAAKDLGAALSERINGGRECPASITTFSPAKVDSISHLKDRASVQIINAVTDEPQEQVSAAFVILADGGRSSLNQQLGITTQKHDYEQVGILANLRASVPHRQIAYERFTENGPIALLPLRDNDYKLVWTVKSQDKEAVLALSDSEFLQAIQVEFGDRAGEFERVGKRIAYPMMESKTGQMTVGRVALIGNSAHTLHPIAGQGFNLGLRDVACLAELIADAHVAGEDIANPALMARYVDERQSDIARTATFTDGLVRAFSNRNLPLAAVRNMSLLAIDRSPMLKRTIMYKMMGLAGKRGKLLRGLPLKDSAESSNNSSADTFIAKG